jgi:ABC-2 type transport system ATP-binding protein
VPPAGRGRIALVTGYGSGEPIKATPAPTAAARSGMQVTIVVRRAAQLVGAPKVTLTYTGKGRPAKNAKVFAQLLDVKRQIVVGNQVTPIPLTLDGRRHTVTRELTPIAAAATKGTVYRLQLISSSKVWAPQRGVGTITVAKAKVVLPTVKAG